MKIQTSNKDLRQGIYAFDITLEHINQGKGNGSKCCPVYLAIAERFPGFTVKVLRTSVQVFPSRGNKGLYGKLPMEAIEFGYALDHGQTVQPFEFRVKLLL